MKDEAWKWHQAPVKTQWGDDMVVADLAIDKDHTVSIYCERDQTVKVEAMFNPPAAPVPCCGQYETCTQACTPRGEFLAKREAQTAQPAPVQEPVGTYGEIFESMLSLLRTGLQRDQQIYMEMKDKPLYTTPPAAQRQWVGLTDDDIEQEFGFIDELLRDCVQRTEAKLKEKNA
jgi:hypothetical protein